MSWFRAASGRIGPPRLAPRPVVHEPPLDAQRLWFAVHRRPWSSLVIVPADEGCPTLPVALALAEVTALQRGRPPLLLPAESIDLPGSASLLSQIRLHAAADGFHDPVVVPLGTFSAYPAGVAVARAADAVLICVALGSTRLRAARNAIELAGRERVLGYVALEGKVRR